MLYVRWKIYSSSMSKKQKVRKYVLCRVSLLVFMSHFMCYVLQLFNCHQLTIQPSQQYVYNKLPIFPKTNEFFDSWLK